MGDVIASSLCAPAKLFREANHHTGTGLLAVPVIDDAVFEWTTLATMILPNVASVPIPWILAVIPTLTMPESR
jgi:hypothetical protein